MDLAIQLCAYLIWIPLQLLTISVLLRGGYRRFPLIFLYLIVLFLATIAEMPAVFAFLTTNRSFSRVLSIIYLTDEVILNGLMFAIVISLIYEVTARFGPRRLVRKALVFGAAAGPIVSFAIHYVPNAPRVGVWMVEWNRDMKLGATILVLALWMFLISSRKKDHLLLLLSGAMGILFTGEAIGESLRSLATPSHIVWLSRFGSLTVVAANLAFTYLWWSAFRQEAHQRSTTPRTA